MDNRGCNCNRCDMVEVLMEFGNITREEAEKRINEILKRKEDKEDNHDQKLI